MSDHRADKPSACGQGDLKKMEGGLTTGKVGQPCCVVSEFRIRCGWRITALAHSCIVEQICLQT